MFDYEMFFQLKFFNANEIYFSSFQKIEEKRLEVNEVPLQDFSTELACVLNTPQCYSSWPLLSDPCHVGLFLVKRIFPDIQIFDYGVSNIFVFLNII